MINQDLPEIYDFIIKPIRRADNETQLLKRYLQGMQDVWDMQVSQIRDLPLNNDPRFCPDDLLIYLAGKVGFDRLFYDLVSLLTPVQLRRLISLAVPIWKQKGTQKGLFDVFRIFTDKLLWQITWFDTIWLLEEGYFDTREPWLVGDPGGIEGTEYWNDLFVMDPGDLDRDIALLLIEAFRPLSERMRLAYMDFMDRFLIDYGWWKTWLGIPPVIVDGELYFDPGAGISSFSDTKLDGTVYDWTDTQSEIVFKKIGNGRFWHYFYYTSSNLYYVVMIDPYQFYQSRIRLYRYNPLPTLLGTVYINKLRDDVPYRLTVQALRMTSGDNYIELFIDGDPVLQYTDSAGTKPIHGTIGFKFSNEGAGNLIKGWLEDVMLWQRPIEYNEVTP